MKLRRFIMRKKANILMCSIQNQLKSIIRSPTILLAVLASLIYRFSMGFDHYFDASGNNIDTELFLGEEALPRALNAMMNFVSFPIERLLFPFIAVVIAVDLFKERNHHMLDVISAGVVSFGKYYLSKLISYWAVSIVFCFATTLLYEIAYIIIQVPANPNFDWGTLLIAQIVAMLVTYTSCVFVPIAWTVFLIGLTGVPAVGVIFNCVYFYFPMMIAGFTDGITYWEHYIHVFPSTLWLYLQSWIRIPEGQWFTYKFSMAEYYGKYKLFTSFTDALIAYGWQIGISVVLLFISGFILKKRFQYVSSIRKRRIFM